MPLTVYCPHWKNKKDFLCSCLWKSPELARTSQLMSVQEAWKQDQGHITAEGKLGLVLAYYYRRLSLFYLAFQLKMYLFLT